MVRLLLTAGLICFSTLLAAPAQADPRANCPPLCDQIPATAWPDPAQLPLYSSQRWGDLAQVARTVPWPQFKAEELCGKSRPIGDPREYAVASRAVLGDGDPGQWQLQAQVVHWRGDTWMGGQLASAVFDAAVRALRECHASAPDYSVKISTSTPTQVAAVLTGPKIVHQYLISDPRNSTISELVLFADAGTTVPWQPLPDQQVLAALAAPLCTAYIGSCG